MSESQYKALGWSIFITMVGIAVYWCTYETGPAGYIMGLTERLTGTRLTQISWLITVALLGLPGWMIKNYCEGLAWNAHVRNLPPPDIRETAKKSKYVKTDGIIPPPPKPINIEAIPEGQEEFIATCPACGNFFSAKKGSGSMKCPSCGEAVPIG